MDRKPDITPLLEALRQLIRDEGSSQRRVEKEVGFSKGYLSQLLAKNLDLKVWHLLAVLEALGCSPGEFFDRVFPRTDDALAAFVADLAPLDEGTENRVEHLYRGDDADISALLRRLRAGRESLDRLANRADLGEDEA